MRFPLAQTLKIAAHILRHRLRGSDKFAMVLQLEPLHTCNLSCTGCGRIREYPTALSAMLGLDECLNAARECGAPMVSICGGEPLLYPAIEELVAGLLRQGRIVYLCTNGLLMRRKLRDYLSSRYQASSAKVEPLLTALVADGLLSPAQAAEIRRPRDPQAPPPILPARRFWWNVHLDGLEETHDRIVERKGVFRECVAAIRLARRLGFRVATNTTVYRQTDMDEVERLLRLLGTLGVEGHTISPGYDFDAAKLDMVRRRGLRPEEFFLTRATIVQKFRGIEAWGRRFPLLGTPVYLEFLAGKRSLACSAWAIPTRNSAGWKGPCYLITDAHHATYRELLEKTDWERYGTVNGQVRDPRCANCMTHCGHEPTASLGLGGRRGDLLRNLVFNLGPRPVPPPPEELPFFDEQHTLNGASVRAGSPKPQVPAVDPLC